MQRSVGVEAWPAAELTCQLNMPELSRFYGIIIRMFVEVAAPHHRPHFHAYYQDHVSVFSFDPVELISGEIPSPATASRGVGRVARGRVGCRLATASGGTEAATNRAAILSEEPWSIKSIA